MMKVETPTMNKNKTLQCVSYNCVRKREKKTQSKLCIRLWWYLFTCNRIYLMAGFVYQIRRRCLICCYHVVKLNLVKKKYTETICAFNLT